MNIKKLITLMFLATLLVPTLACVGGGSTPYTEVQFTTVPDHAYRINGYAEDGDTIEWDWKADNPVYFWYETPGGISMLPGLISNTSL